MIYSKRKSLAKYSATLGKALSFCSGTTWTITGLILSFASAYFIIRQDFAFASILLFFAVLCDFVDGSVARFRGEASNIGAYYDTIMDRYAEGIIAISIIFVSLPYVTSYAWDALYLFGSLMTTYAKAAAKEKNLTEKEITGGLLERPERMILLVIGLGLASIDVTYLSNIIIALAILTNITALQRIFMALKHAKKKLL